MRGRLLAKWSRGTTWVVAGLLVLGGAEGCATQTQAPLGQWTGPTTLDAPQRAPWSYNGIPGETITTRNYRVYSTVANPAVRVQIAQLLEASILEYRKLIPEAPEVQTPMDAFLFSDRNQWIDFTKKNTGPDSAVYLKIQRGGYAVRDFFVSYYTQGGETQLWSVTAHEGFHQFCARNLKGRLPPFLEEGLATTYEVVHWDPATQLPKLNHQVNPFRAQALKAVYDLKGQWPLEQLVRMHAGSVVGQAGTRIEAFYSQSWAFARFLQEYKNGKYKPAFDRWLQGTVSGQLFDPTGTHRRTQQYWDPAAVKPIMEHYLETDMKTLSAEFDEWCRYLAYEEYPRQWASAQQK